MFDYILIYYVLNYRLEEFERLNIFSKKIDVPAEKSMTRINFHRQPAKIKPPKVKVSGHPFNHNGRGEREAK